MHFTLLIAAFVLILNGCKTISESPVLAETVDTMQPMSSLVLPEKWTPIKNIFVWDDLQFVYPATNRMIPEFSAEDCRLVFLNPGKKQVQLGMIAETKFYSCIGSLIAQSGSDVRYQELITEALLNWSAMPSDPWRQIPKRPYDDAKPYWYESTSNFSVVASWYALNRDKWDLSDQQKSQIDSYLQEYFQWADFDTPNELGRIACPLGNPSRTANERVDTNTCGSVRMKGATATLALALATNHQPTYEKALQHMAVIFHQYDEEGFFVPYMAAQKQGFAFSYYYESARFLSSWVELYATVGIDILDYRMPSGVTIADALTTAYRVTKDHTLLGKYKPNSNFNYGGFPGSSWEVVRKMSQQEFENTPSIYGAWDFNNNDARFALHNPRFAIERLSLKPSWESGYDHFDHSDFHGFQPAHLYLANQSSSASLEKQLASFDGSYEVEWAIANVNADGWELVSVDQLNISGGNGIMVAERGAPGSPEQRNALSISVAPNGDIRVSGQLGLFDTRRSYETRLSGSIPDQQFTGVWHDGDLIRGTLRQLD